MNLDRSGEFIAPSHRGLGFYVWRLLRLRWQIAVSIFKHARLIRKIGQVILYIFLIAVMAGVFYASWQILRVLESPEGVKYVGDMSTFMDSLPAIILAGAFLGILLTSFGVLLQALYLARDMDFLLSTPVPLRAVFVTKLIEAILPNFSLVAILGLPILVGLGIARGYNFIYYPLLVVLMACLALAAAGISGLLVMAVVRVFPARRVAEVLGFLGAILSLVCSQSANIMNFSQKSEFELEQVSQPLGRLAGLNTPWLPLSWPGRGLADIGAGNWLSGVFFVALTLAMTLAIFYFSLATAERLYYTGWASIQISVQKKRQPRLAGERPSWRGWARFTSGLVAVAESLIIQPVRGIILKDFLMLRRDLRNLSQVITPMIFGIIYAIMLFNGDSNAPPTGRGEAPEWFMTIMENMWVYANIGISLFVTWGVASRLASVGFVQEGRSYWMLKVAPISPERLLAAKFLVAYLPPLLLGWTFLLIITLIQKGGLGVLLYGVLVVALTIAGIIGIDLGFGARNVKLDWTSPQQMQSKTSGCLSSIVGLAYMALALSIFFLLPLLFAILRLPDWVGWLLGLSVGGAFCLTVAILPLWLARKYVTRIGEEV